MSVVEPPMLPQALDAEEALLGSILIDPEAALLLHALKPDDFYRDAHATIFATMRQLEDDGVPLDAVTVLTRLERTGQLERAGGSAYVLGLVNAVPTSQNARYYAHLVQQAAERRKVIQIAGDVASIGYHSSDPARAAVRAVETLAAAREQAEGLDLSPEEALARLEALAPPLYAADELLAQTFNDTKWVVPNLLPERLTLLAAKPKLGKSWMALGLALAVAAGSPALGDTPVTHGEVLYLALEDSPKRLHERVKRLLRGQPAPHALQLGTEWPRLDQDGLRFLEVWRLAHPDARLIILDTFAKIRGQAKSGTLYGDDYASLEDVQRLAHAYEMAILVIHHTGKESRDDPLDEVNTTQGLNGVADNVLVLRRERGKPTATLIGDGRELNGIEQALRFDVDDGGWQRAEPEPDQPKTPERAEILDLLKASDAPMSRKQIAEALDKNSNTISTLLARMVRDGDIKMTGYARYIPANSVNTSALKEEDKKHIPSLFEKENMQVATVLTLLTPSQESEVEKGKDDSEASSPAAPPAEFQRFAEMVARETHSRVDEYTAIATPDADDPYTLKPSGLRPASRGKAAKGNLWPIAGDCTGLFCEGECVCGEHRCDGCGCEAGALVDDHPWYFKRHEVRRGAVCEYCFAPATVASRWKTPLCERCWQIASRGQGIDPRSYQPRPFGPIPGDVELEEAAASGD